MEKKTLYLIYVIIVLPFAVACRDTEDNLTVSTLRSDIHDYLYTINNSEATQRLDSIMYNKTDTDKIYERFKIVHISDPHISAISTNNNYTNPINLKQSVTFANQTQNQCFDSNRRLYFQFQSKRCYSFHGIIYKTFLRRESYPVFYMHRQSRLQYDRKSLKKLHQ